jgi:hypothetical protein
MRAPTDQTIKLQLASRLHRSGDCVGRLLVPAAGLPSKPPTDLTLLVVLTPLAVPIPSQEDAIGFQPDVRIPFHTDSDAPYQV